MKIRSLASIALVSASLGLAGCTTMADAVQARGSGATATYQASFDEVWAALPSAISDAGLQFVSANRDDRSVLAQRGMTLFSYGENVAIFVDPIEDGRSSVEVVSKKAMQTNVFAPDWTKAIFRELDKKFRRV